MHSTIRKYTDFLRKKKEIRCYCFRYTSCIPFKNGTKVSFNNEVIVVTCRPQPKTKKEVIYEDVYMLLKKQTRDENSTKTEEKSWNVLLLGMDTMSRARAFHSMPKMVKYFERNNWLDFRAFQKVTCCVV